MLHVPPMENLFFSRSEGGMATGLKSLDVDVKKHWMVGWRLSEQMTEKDDILQSFGKK